MLWVHARGVKEQAADIRVGQLLELHDGALHEVVGTSRAGEGRGGASVHLKLRRIVNGSQKHLRFSTSDTVERAVLNTRTLSLMYIETGEKRMALLDEETLDQPELPLSLLPSSQQVFLAEGCTLYVHFYQDRAVSAALPRRMTLDVTHAEAYVHGDTQTSGSKHVTVASGASVRVPPYVDEGDRIVVDTHTGEFVKRVL